MYYWLYSHTYMAIQLMTIQPYTSGYIANSHKAPKQLIDSIWAKGAGVFRRPGQNVEDLCNFGTSRTSNELTLCRYTQFVFGTSRSSNKNVVHFTLYRCYGTLTSFQVDFFTQYGAMRFWLFFLPFLGPLGPGMTPGWGIKEPNISFPNAWGVLWHIIQFPG